MKNGFRSGLLALFLLTVVFSFSEQEEPQQQQHSLSSLIAQATTAPVSLTARSSPPSVPSEDTDALSDATAQPESALGMAVSLLAGQAIAAEAIAAPPSALPALLANAPTTSTATSTIWPTATPAPTHQPIYASYIGNKSTKKFHRPDCGSAKQIAQNNVTSFSSREEAVNQGYQPCKRCKP